MRLPKQYIEFIDSCRGKRYDGLLTHTHHITPRHMGGGDEESNLIQLSVEDHFMAHRILAETVEERWKSGAWAALRILKKYWSGEDNELRQKMAESTKGQRNGFYGRTHSDSYKERLRKEMKGKGNHFYGKAHSSETRKHLSEVHADVSGGKNPAAKKCIDNVENKVYSCIKEMAKAVGVPRPTMNRWVKDKRNTRYNYYNV